MLHVHRVRTGLAGLLLALSLPTAALAAGDPALLDSELMPRAPRALLLDVAARAQGFVAVGERGHVLLSDDGLAWQQVVVPTRSTLTAVAAVDGDIWAAGHDGVILHSADDGKTWERVRAEPWTPEADDPDQGAPILDLLVLDEGQALAVGAYSQLLLSSDGGRNWERGTAVADEAGDTAAPAARQDDADWTFSEDDLALEAESDPHLNAIARAGSGELVIAGERGAFLRSRDGGRQWQRLPLPYEGSLFGVLAWEGQHILLFGLRGNVLESRDLGDTWVEVETGISDSLMGGAALPGGGAILVGANGAVLYRPDAASAFRADTFETASGDTPVLSGVLPLPDGRFLLIGDKGVDVYQPR